jgi:hypothetical protein
MNRKSVTRISPRWISGVGLAGARVMGSSLRRCGRGVPRREGMPRGLSACCTLRRIPFFHCSTIAKPAWLPKLCWRSRGCLVMYLWERFFRCFRIATGPSAEPPRSPSRCTIPALLRGPFRRNCIARWLPNASSTTGSYAVAGSSTRRTRSTAWSAPTAARWRCCGHCTCFLRERRIRSCWPSIRVDATVSRVEWPGCQLRSVGSHRRRPFASDSGAAYARHAACRSCGVDAGEGRLGGLADGVPGARQRRCNGSGRAPFAFSRGKATLPLSRACVTCLRRPVPTEIYPVGQLPGSKACIPTRLRPPSARHTRSIEG